MLQIAEIAEAFQGAVGEDGEMDAYELMNLLNETGFISGYLCYLIHDRVLHFIFRQKDFFVPSSYFRLCLM